jgi:putative methionine-R-sulfoxide reductase with GAF domain
MVSLEKAEDTEQNLKLMLEGEADLIAALANVSAVLNATYTASCSVRRMISS